MVQKIFCIFLCVCIFLTGCSQKQQAAPPKMESGSSMDGSREQEEPSDSGAAEQLPTELQLCIKTMPLPEELTFATAQCVFQNRLVVGGCGPAGTAIAYTDENKVWTVLPVPDTSKFIYGMCVSEKKLVVLGGSFPKSYHTSDWEPVILDEPAGKLELLWYDSGLNLVRQTPLAQTYQEIGMAFQSIHRLKDGFLLGSCNYLIKIAEDGTELARRKAESNTRFAGAYGEDGQCYALVHPFVEQSSSLAALDSETLEIREQTAFPDERLTGISGQDGTLLLNSRAENGVISWPSGEMVLPWSAFGLTTPVFSNIEKRKDGWLFSEVYETCITYAVLEAAVPRTVLTLAVDAPGVVTAIVNDFNLAQTQYRVEVTSGSAETGESNPLAAEILTGTGPDLFCFSDPATMQDTESAVYCEDLLPYLDADPVCNRDYFLPSLLACMQEGAHLYWLPYSFQIETMTAPSSVFPHPGITMEDVRGAAGVLDSSWRVFPSFMTDDMLLYWVSLFSLSSFVDFEHGTCDFTCPAFIGLMQLCQQWGGNGDAVMGEKCLLQMEQVQTPLRLYGLNQNYHGDYTYVGFPNETGNGSIFSLTMKLAISNQCKDKQGAWEFLRFAAGPDGMAYLGGSGFSAAQENLFQALDTMKNEGTPFGGQAQRITQEDYEKFLELLRNTTTVSGQNGTILQLIQEEAAAFLDGRCSAQQAAEQIQNRTALYLAERQ